ncbi:hypothetical protein [Enterovirga rhinocerotis]|nr:hypothetical protein [Enterovirga rhinocerotis]
MIAMESVRTVEIERREALRCHRAAAKLDRCDGIRRRSLFDIGVDRGTRR